MIRDVPEVPRLVNMVQGKRRQTRVNRYRETLDQSRMGNNTIGEDIRVTKSSGRVRSLSGSCELATLSRLREGQQPTGLTTDSVDVLIHAFSGGDGDLSHEGMLLMGRGNIDVGEQMGGMTDTSRVGVRRGRMRQKLR